MTVSRRSADAAECRRLAELLHLDAVGVLRADGRRRLAWWASPGTDVVPLERILDGSAPGWVALPRGDDLVFAHLPTGSSARSISALSAMLASLAADPGGADADGLDGVAPENRIERERMRLAYAIHDGLTQVVTASVLELEWQARRVEVSPKEATEALTAAAAELRVALQEIRSVLAGLSPDGGDSPQPLDDLIRGVIDRWQLPATWSVEGDLTTVPAPLLEVASSVIREGVANAAKHADSQAVSVRVRVTRNGLDVRVEDRGKGFSPGGTDRNGTHLGLEMMRRRVAEVSGTLDIESSPGEGTRVVARLPVPDQGVKP